MTLFHYFSPLSFQRKLESRALPPFLDSCFHRNDAKRVSPTKVKASSSPATRDTENTLKSLRWFYVLSRSALRSLSLEPLHAAGRVNNLVRPRVERVTATADFNPEFGLGGTNGKNRPACAGYFGFRVVLRVDVALHGFNANTANAECTYCELRLNLRYSCSFIRGIGIMYSRKPEN